ncbi:hypothetical protein KKI24_24525 [bacterium]|nr:hypothetical protein [bacterium]
MINKSRRNFFNDVVENSVQFLAKAVASFQSEEAEPDTNYFSSYESAYTLISENLPFLDEEVERLNIDTTGKSNLEIVKEVYEKTHVDH